MDPEDNENVGSTEEHDEFGNKNGSLVIALEPITDDNANEKQRALEKEQGDTFNDKCPNSDTFFNHFFTKQAPT